MQHAPQVRTLYLDCLQLLLLLVDFTSAAVFVLQSRDSSGATQIIFHSAVCTGNLYSKFSIMPRAVTDTARVLRVFLYKELQWACFFENTYRRHRT